MSPYGIGKVAIEDYLAYYGREHHMETVSLRISNPYGPRQNSSRQGLVPIVLRKLLANQEIDVMDAGSMVRDYIDIRDLTRMIVNISASDTVAHPVYNLGTGIGTSVSSVIDLAETVSGIKAKRRHIDRPRGFVEYSVLNTDRYTQTFGDEARVPFRTGIEDLWNLIQQ